MDDARQSEVSKRRHVGLQIGLTRDEARRQLEKFGPNAMPDTTLHPLRMALEKFWAPIPWMLEAAIVLQLVLGKYVEASSIAGLLVFNAAPGLFQESRAQATLAATIGFVKFSVARPKTVGGSIAIAAITKHEGFQWVQRQKGFGTSRI